MSKTSLCRQTVGAVAAAATVLCAMAQGVQIGDLRVLGTQTNCFEFKLMSAMATARSTKLVFNRLDGTTHIVAVGDRLGDYTVAAYTARVERVFNPTINAHQNRNTGTATLRGPDGRERVLPMGATAPDAGWMACIAATNSGVTRYVRSGDELDTAPQRARVARVDDEGVCVTVDGLEALLPWAAEEERAALTERWATQARQRQADVAAAARPPEPEVLPMYPQPERPGPTLPDRPPQRRIGFGVDYPYPVEYEVIPVRMRTPDGRIVDRGILLPTRFERRAAGVYGSTIEHSSGMGPRILPGPAPRYP